jgi:AGCS family alanine or glycine:cation symporter
MEKAREVIGFLANLIWSTPDFFPIMVMLLLLTGLVMTVRTRFVQIRLFFHSWKVMFGVYDKPGEPGDINHFQTISAVLSATVGIGNIAGVATAIHYGGPGALFWMWVTAALGMALKYSEAMLAVKYRKQNADGSYSGGPMYYIEKGLGKKWKWMAGLFASMAGIAALGIGNTIQAFTMADQMRADFAVPTWISGLFSATVVGIVIIGGVKRIGKVTAILSPFMCLFYILGGFAILALNYRAIPDSFKLILSNAFTPTASVGGFAGATFLYGMMWGVKRGLFSNEAGQGSAPILHAVAKTDEPPEEGANSMLGPFIDTLVVCTITGLVIIITGVWNQKKPDLVLANTQAAISVVTNHGKVAQNSIIKGDVVKNINIAVENGRVRGDYAFIRNNGVVDSALILVNRQPFTGTINIDVNGLIKTAESNELVSLQGLMLQNGSILTGWAFEKGLSPIGNWGGFIITIGVFLFAISTAISWYFYGDRGVQYIFGDRGVFYYKWIYVGLHFIGAIVSLELVWSFGDVANGLMAIPNLIAVLLLSGVVKRDTYEYTHRRHFTAKENIKMHTKS